MRGRLLFENLVLGKTLLFQFRPWESIPVRKDVPYLVQFGWAISASHLPLLEAIFAKKMRERHLEFATRACWLEEQLRDPSIPQDLLRAWRTYPLGISRNVGDWGTWLYCQLLRSVRDGNIKITQACFRNWDARKQPGHQAMQSWMERLISHLILEAAISNQDTIVDWLYSIRSNSMWLTCDYNSRTSKMSGCNAIEHAALQRHGKTIEILFQLCPISESFINNVLRGGLLSALVENRLTRDVNRLKCLLKVLSEPLHATTRLKSASSPTATPSTPPLDSQVKSSRLRFFSRTSSAKTDANVPPGSGASSKDLYIGKLKAILTAASLDDEEALGEPFYSRVTNYENKATALDEHHGALFCAIANDNPRTAKYVLGSGQSLLPDDVLSNGFAGPSHDSTHTEYLAFIPDPDLEGHDRSPLDFAIRLAKTDESGVKYQAIIDLLLGSEGPIYASPEERVWLETESLIRKRNDRRTRLEAVSLDGKDSRIYPRPSNWELLRSNWSAMLIYPACCIVIWVVLFWSMLPGT
jgi:hypothetical protein